MGPFLFPAIGQLPGGPELLVIFLVLMLLGIPALAVAVLGYMLFAQRSETADPERVAELEQEITELRGELAELAEEDGSRDDSPNGDETIENGSKEVEARDDEP